MSSVVSALILKVSAGVMRSNEPTVLLLLQIRFVSTVSPAVVVDGRAEGTDAAIARIVFED